MHEMPSINSINEGLLPQEEQIRTEKEVFERITKYYVGDIHVHNTHSLRDSHSEEVLNPKVVSKYAGLVGLKFLAFSNHTSNPGSPRLISQIDDPVNISLGEEYLDNEKLAQKRSVKILNSLEANIFVDESGEPAIDVSEEQLGKANVAFASIHAIGNVNKRDPEQIKALLNFGIKNPYVEIGHPHRHIEMWPNDWDYFRKYMSAQYPESKEIALIEQIHKAAKSDESAKVALHKIIGKVPFDGSESSEIESLSLQFSTLEKDYWEAWENVLNAYVENGKCFEINLNAFDPNGAYYQKLLAMVAEKNIPLIISTDFHSKRTFKDIPSKSLKNKLPENLGKAASAKMLRRMLDLIDLLEENGIDSSRVINSSEKNIEQYRQYRNLRIGMSVLQNNETFGELTDPESICNLLDVQQVEQIRLTKFSKTADESYMVPEKFIIEIAADQEKFSITYNRNYNFRDLGNLSQAIREKHPTIVPEYKTLLDGQALVSKHVNGQDFKTLGREAELETSDFESLGNSVGRLATQLHSINPNEIQQYLNQDNSSMENILATVNADTIEKITRKNPAIGNRLQALAESIIEQEKKILSNKKLSLIHGDFHPGNVIVDPQQNASIIDIKNMTLGLPERDIASMLIQAESQLKDYVDQADVVTFQNTLMNAYEAPIDQNLVEFYTAWISFRNALYMYSKVYLGNSMNQRTKDAAEQAINRTAASLANYLTETNP